MKQLICCLLFAMLCVGACFSQSMQPQYSSYTTLAVDQNFNFIQTVQVSGTTTGACCQTVVCGPNGMTCQECNQQCLNALHLPKIYNWVNGIGGWTQGQFSNPFGYIVFSSTVSTTTPPLPEIPVQVESQGEIWCSGLAAMIFAGTFLENYGEIVVSYGKAVTPGMKGNPATCSMTTYCDSSSYVASVHAVRDNYCSSHYMVRAVCAKWAGIWLPCVPLDATYNAVTIADPTPCCGSTIAPGPPAGQPPTWINAWAESAMSAPGHCTTR